MKTEICETIPCSFCQKNFDEVKTLDDHMWKDHLQQTSQCGLCGLRFAFPQELSAHVRTKCSLASSRERSTSSYGKKVISSIRCKENCNDEQYGKNCGKSICDFTCDNVTMLYYHKMLKHIPKPDIVTPHSHPDNKSYSLRPYDGHFERRLPCILCNKIVSRGKLWQHLCTHGEKYDVDNRKCDKCSKIFSTIPHLQAHKRRTKHHNINQKSDTKRLRCRSCSKRFSDQYKLQIHTRNEHSKRQKHLTCSLAGCAYTTTKSSHLKIHQLVHDQDIENRLLCQMCGAFSCKRKSELNRHIRIHHSNECDKPSGKALLPQAILDTNFKCDSCN